MPRPGIPQYSNFFRPWGFSYTDYSRAWDEYKRTKDQDYFEKWGFYPEQRAGVMRAADRADQSFGQALGSLGDMRSQILSGPGEQGITDYYQSLLRGEQDPFTPSVLAALSSRISDPFYKSARTAIGNARSNFAARGLGRSGGLVGLENQYLTEAIGRALSEGSNLRANAAVQNAQFRQQGVGAYGGYRQGQNALLSSLAQGESQLWADRQYDPAIEAMRTNSERRGYKPPPPAPRRSYGTSAPSYGTTPALAAIGR